MARGIGTVQSGAGIQPQIRRTLMKGFQNVVAGQTAFVEPDIGWRYHAFQIPYGGTTFDVTKMGNVRVYLNGEIVWNCLASIMDTINQFDGLPAAATYKVLTLNLERMGLKNILKRFDTAVNTGIKCPQAPNGISKFRIEVDILGTAVAPALGPAVALTSFLNPAQGNLILRRKTFSENVPGGAAEYLFVNKYNANPNEPLISRIYFGETAANLTNIHLQEDGTDLANITSLINEHDQAADKIKSVNTSVVILDSTASGSYNNAWRVRNAKAFDIKIIDSNANASLPVIVDTLGLLTAA